MKRQKRARPHHGHVNENESYSPAVCKQHRGANQYQGWGWKKQKLERVMEIPVVKADASDAKTFWADHISLRKPAIFRAGAHTVCSHGTEWSLDYLKSKAGPRKVSVERQIDKEGFGKGVREDMLFHELLDGLQRGSESLYMTTQDVKVLEDGQSPLLMSPALELRQDYEWRPAMMGNLVPQTINLWIGSSKAGSSSGLHHDFHDNLYVLLKGKKVFRLWCPAHAEEMYTHGKIRNVYPNGLIIYEGQGDVQSDGFSKEVLAKDNNIKEDSAREDDDLELDSEAELEAALEQEIGSRKRKKGKTSGLGHDDFDELEATQIHSTHALDHENLEPLSFSQIDLNEGEAKIKEQFQSFPGLEKCLTTTLEAGDMLYLPAGWFHEVTSMNSKSIEQAAGANVLDCNWHMALNYWFHPPDNLNPGVKGFRKPYQKPSWPDLYTKRYSNNVEGYRT